MEKTRLICSIPLITHDYIPRKRYGQINYHNKSWAPPGIKGSDQSRDILRHYEANLSIEKDVDRKRLPKLDGFFLTIPSGTMDKP